jgi:hypothetical protein
MDTLTTAQEGIIIIAILAAGFLVFEIIKQIRKRMVDREFDKAYADWKKKDEGRTINNRKQ